MSAHNITTDEQSVPIAIGSETYNEMLQFYYTEASLLDNIRLEEWGQMLAEDLKYGVPIRQTRMVKDTDATVVRSVQHYHDDYRSIMGRILRLSGKSAWAEDPPSRVRRFVSNIQVSKRENSDEFEVVSYLLITRNRFDDDFFDLIPCERHDLVRKTETGLKLAKREVILDQALLGTPNLAIFL
ncbi:aromatic-ring-hydroxylating dioxygenase subunit beta [Pseudomaricurvus alkylphenolicus]|uniref:aromatic-ring-hydroxylating dioxygenase subunit beta n=1 Tax=Pseudomaricurvus alkylphenolicus TaxID=1306991 RepID=UPI001420B40B|nr:aromatic-ring-hydroxylating dioxygenase subunit beta [Pseudomaricurvus alkylphenolicus]NIB44107.1 aromatic-ring-hydroxylating dioxygenase subunit beta [Pseudomaricurvus alkylphenolicus]